MTPVRIWYDPDPDQIFIAGAERSYARRTLIAGMSGNTITVRLKGADSLIVSARFSDVGGIDGVPFSSPEQTLAYLQGEFAKRRPAGFVFVQDQPAPLWTIHHGLGFQPSLSLVDTAGDAMTADWRYPDVDTVTVTFDVPASGTAYLS